MSILPRHLFEAYGVELEYMIVDHASFDVRPLADGCLRHLAGAAEFVSDAELGPITVSNELVAHVLELKTTDPAAALAPLPEQFEAAVRQVTESLQPLAARLMPTAMHPWMDPAAETRLWPHDNSEVYEAFNRVFDCRGHGWSNLQSVHLNLPFADDDEFGRLHAAVRLLLPILPALAASSPLVERRRSAWLDTRLEMYRHNSQRIPAVAGRVIPEPAFTAESYRRQILEPMWQAIAPYDAQGVLQHEWLNARGAIARFDRSTIEIRVLDVQECPQADLAICAAIVAVLKALVSQRWCSLAEQQSWSVDRLEPIWLRAIRLADGAMIDDRDYLQMFGLTAECPMSAGRLWRWLVEQAAAREPEAARFGAAWEVLLDQGPLARRMLRRLPDTADPVPEDALHAVMDRLCNCLIEGKMLIAGPE